MAGIIFWSSSSGVKLENVNRTFDDLGYKKGVCLSNEVWNVVIFPKDKYEIKNYRIMQDGFICGVGTFLYKEWFYDDALETIYRDLKRGDLKTDGFLGSFLILVVQGSSATLIRDGAMLSRLHKERECQVFSSSFAGLLGSLNRPFSIDKNAVIELLSTGLVSDNSTIVSEVEMLGDEYIGQQGNLNVLSSKTSYDYRFASRNEAQEGMIESISTYMSKLSLTWLKYNPLGVANLSLTGGLDSRLLTAFVKETKMPYEFYTYWRNPESGDKDFPLAKYISKYLNKPLFYSETTSIEDLTDDARHTRFLSAYKSCDGVIRPGTFWDEETSTIQLRAGLSNSDYIRLTGFEGEYFRNMERFPLVSKRSYSEWVKWEMIYRFAGFNFTDQLSQQETERRIISNISRKIGTGSLSLYKHKEYYKRILVPSYRSFQSNFENRIGFCINPFADEVISASALAITPFIGNSLDFEIDMLKKVSLELAALPNDYGFDFVQGESLWTRTATDVWQKLPQQIKHKLFSIYRGGYKDMKMMNTVNESKFLTSLINEVMNLGIPIDVYRLMMRSTRGKIVLNLGFFLLHNKENIHA